MNKKEQQALIDKWNLRLEEEGLPDIQNGVFANAPIKKAASTKIKNGDSEQILAIYNQFINFYRNNNFHSIYKTREFPVYLKRYIKPDEVEKIFLMWVEGETIRFITGFFLPNLSYHFKRDLVYQLLRVIFKYTTVHKSKSLKFEAQTFISNFSQGFSKRGGVGRGGKTTEKRQTCKGCKNKFYPQEKKAAFDYCGDCIQIQEYCRSGNKKEIKYILKSTGETINPHKPR